MPACRGDRLGGAPVVAGDHVARRAQPLQLRHGLARVRLERVGDGDDARRAAAVDGHEHRRLALVASRSSVGSRARPTSTPSLVHEPAVAEQHALARRPCRVDAVAGDRPRSSRRLGELERRSPRACCDDRLGQRVLGRRARATRRGASSSSASCAAPERHDDVGHRRACPVVSVPVLSRTMAVSLWRVSQRLAALDEDAVLGALAGADHDRGRRGQAQGARAGDDEHGHRSASRRARREGRARGPTTARSTKVAPRRCRAPRARRRRRPRRRAAGSAPWSPAPPRRAGRSGRAPCPCRPCVARKRKAPVRLMVRADDRVARRLLDRASTRR